MKKYLMIAAAALFAMVSCTDNVTPEEPDVPETKDEITLSESTLAFSAEGGDLEVMVTSSSDWTLTPAETYDWITPSSVEGADGDIVTFTALENYDSDKAGEFVFTVGKATATLKVTSVAGEKPVEPYLTLTGDKKVSVDHKGGELILHVKSNVAYRDVKVSFAEGGNTWCTHKTNLEGEEDVINLVFEVSALEGLVDRSTVITLSAEGVNETVEVELTQMAEKILNADSYEYTILPAGGELEIPISSNITYSINIPEDAASWIAHTRTDANNVEIFTVQPLESGLRQTDITFAQTDAVAGAEPLTFTVTVYQMTSLVAFAAKMDDARFYIKDLGDLPNKDGYDALTIECLINSSAFDHIHATVWNFSELLTLRFGDEEVKEDGKNVKKHTPEIAIALEDKTNYYYAPMGFMFSGLSENDWHHVAFIYKKPNYKLIIDGNNVVINSSLPVDKAAVNPFKDWGAKSFMIGGGANDQEDFHGMITEFRIWNKALTESEIQENDHFYNVNPSSDNLMLYWKFNGGKSNIIKNVASGPHALKGNNLYGEINVTNGNGTAGINWQSVNLPEKE